MQQIQVKYPKSKEYFRKLEYTPEPYEDVLKNGGAKKMGFGTGELRRVAPSSDHISVSAAGASMLTRCPFRRQTPLTR